jgi:hypothetical protein
MLGGRTASHLRLEYLPALRPLYARCLIQPLDPVGSRTPVLLRRHRSTRRLCSSSPSLATTTHYHHSLPLLATPTRYHDYHRPSSIVHRPSPLSPSSRRPARGTAQAIARAMIDSFPGDCDGIADERPCRRTRSGGIATSLLDSRSLDCTDCERATLCGQNE